MMLLRKPVLIVIGTVAVIVCGFFFLLRGCLSAYDERSAIPPLLYFEKDGKSVVFSIVKFEKATSYSRKGNFVSKSVSTNYFVQVNDAVTGKKIDDKKIKHHSDIKTHPVRIMGASGNSAWAFIGEIMAFDPFTLEKIADKKILEEKNPSMKGKLPQEERYYKFNRNDKNVYITAIDGSSWVLDTKTLVVSASDFDPEASPAKNAFNQIEKEMKKLVAVLDTLNRQKNFLPGRRLAAKEITMAEYQAITKSFYRERDSLDDMRDSLQKIQYKVATGLRAIEDQERRIESLGGNTFTISFGQMKSNQDTVNGKWYGLYTKQEMEKLYNRVQYQQVYEETARRQLFTSGYHTEDDGDAIIEKDNATPLGNSYSLDGGFLLNRTTAMPIHVGNSTLVIYKNQIGNEGLIQLGRLGWDGKLAWSIDSGLKEWADYVFNGKQLLILGTDNKELSSGSCNVLLIVDLEKGTSVRYDFFTDK
jgi:hypothetical protein